MKFKNDLRYERFLITAFVVLFLASDFVAEAKQIQLGPFEMEGKLIFFPMSYFFDDILTEVYGYSAGRRAIWYGFFALLFTNLMTYILIILPPAKTWPHQISLENVYSQPIRVIFGALLSFLIGKFANIYIIAKMKVWMNGRGGWKRSLVSSFIGELLDTFLFYTIAYIDTIPIDTLVLTACTSFCVKSIWLVIMGPIVHHITEFLKTRDDISFYDTHTNFNPFIIQL
eukprot:NODE_93_length_21530_cov_0.700387.p11 type:complete len:228 gc:universal NODE_93_length_21530_cov_0.700387:2955-2272(-)